MKCINKNIRKCDGEMEPVPGAPEKTECTKCGFRIPTPKQEPKKTPVPVAPVPVKDFVTTEIKETN